MLGRNDHTEECMDKAAWQDMPFCKKDAPRPKLGEQAHRTGGSLHFYTNAGGDCVFPYCPIVWGWTNRSGLPSCNRIHAKEMKKNRGYLNADNTAGHGDLCLYF